MSKAVLISIQPKWCELIASGKKTVEVRKTKPKLDTPFKCYIYCTNDFSNHATKSRRNKFWVGEPINDVLKGRYIGNGKVIGEFLCDRIFPISVYYDNPNCKLALKEFPYVCLTDKQIIDYLGNGKKGYGWHISDLKIYDTPKELGDFQKYGALSYDDWLYCIYNGTPTSVYEDYLKPFKVIHAPQSWCYVEELSE